LPQIDLAEITCLNSWLDIVLDARPWQTIARAYFVLTTNPHPQKQNTPHGRLFLLVTRVFFPTRATFNYGILLGGNHPQVPFFFFVRLGFRSVVGFAVSWPSPSCELFSPSKHFDRRCRWVERDDALAFLLDGSFSGVGDYGDEEGR
jgi:hypothetical protein